ncbi:hypothetical protein T08_12397 [Trichinella sp. T8]|nr:hypothetical protein T08_12397 [Trichinella sp. T8]
MAWDRFESRAYWICCVLILALQPLAFFNNLRESNTAGRALVSLVTNHYATPPSNPTMQSLLTFLIYNQQTCFSPHALTSINSDQSGIDVDELNVMDAISKKDHVDSPFY